MSGAQLEAADVASGYGPARIVDGASLSLPAGGSLALVGGNGAGKTTLIDTIGGRARLQGGAIVSQFVCPLWVVSGLSASGT